MEFAIDSNGNRVSIARANPDVTYFCPCCHSPMIQKRGDLVIHHFAHKSLEDCVEYYDNKGEWHRKMQSWFPEDQQEVFNNEFGRHFYDVLTDKGTIIEFQHSPISYEDFLTRTAAYMQYIDKYSKSRLIWVFDYTMRNFYVLKSHFDNSRKRKLRWYRPTKIFNDYQIKYDGYDLWFRIAPLRHKPTYNNDFYFPQLVDFSSTKYSPAYLKVTGIFDDSIVYGEVYSEKEFRQMLLWK